jgi:flagellar secretion chaperone FliS
MDDQLVQQARRDYVENQVFSAHPVQRVQLLYQLAIDSVNVAIARLKDGDIFARGRAVTKAHEAVDELNLALDHSVGASFTRTLAELYGYIQRQLVQGHSQKSEQAFQEALSVLTTLSETWDEVVRRTCRPSPSDPHSGSNGVSGEEPAEVSEPRAAYRETLGMASTSRDWSG